MPTFASHPTVELGAQQPDRPTRWNRFWAWLIFTVVLALLPIGVGLAFQSFSSGSPHWTELLAGGETLLIAGALASDGLGKLWISARPRTAGHTFRFACCLLILLAVSIYFTEIYGRYQTHRAQIVTLLQEMTASNRVWSADSIQTELGAELEPEIVPYSTALLISAIVVSFSVMISEEQ